MGRISEWRSSEFFVSYRELEGRGLVRSPAFFLFLSMAASHANCSVKYGLGVVSLSDLQWVWSEANSGPATSLIPVNGRSSFLNPILAATAKMFSACQCLAI